MNALLLLLSCARYDAAPEEAPSPTSMPVKEEGKVGRKEKSDEGAAGGNAFRTAAQASAPPAAPGAMADGMFGGMDKSVNLPADEGEGRADQKPATRSWFPESFLWQPLVETGPGGRAVVPVRVPDTLTTWRVLALGLTAAGAQGGAVENFSSTLPAYVDVKLPSFLYAGDSVSLPVQLVSQQAEALDTSLNVSLRGGEGQGAGPVHLPGFGSFTRSISVAVPHAGTLVVKAELAGVDALEKSIPVRPVGRPVEFTRGGTLGGAREFDLDSPPGSTDGSLNVQIFPGALSVVQGEVGMVALRGGGLWEDAYAWALASRAEALVRTGDLSEESRRDLALRSLQRLRRASLSLAPSVAVPILAGVRGAPADSLEGKLAARMGSAVTDAQAPDGLYPGPSTGLDDVLVSTAQAIWALGPENRSNRLRAQGAFERYRDRLNNPYVAAWALVADTAEPQRAEILRKLVKEAIQTSPDGSRYLDAVGTRGDGRPANRIEATALAVLIFKDDEALRSDLASYLLSHYSPSTGFGDGLSGILALQALELALGGEIPSTVSIRLEMDGQEVARGALDPKLLHSPVNLQVPGFSGSHHLKLVSEPAVPGLAFALNSRSYLPWVQAEARGLDLVETLPSSFAIGQPANITVEVAGPANARVDVEIGVPVSSTPDPAVLQALVSSGVCSRSHVQDGQVRLEGLTLTGGKATFSLQVTPTLVGTQRTSPSRVWVDGSEESAFVRVPGVWTVR